MGDIEKHLNAIPNKLREWLDLELDENNARKRYEILAELFCRNRFSMTVDGWGIYQDAHAKENPYGSWGLSQDQGISLMRYAAFLEGAFTMMEPPFLRDAIGISVLDLLDAEIEKTKVNL